ncbi:GNAT family N-acetyltransferase [Actinoallomurus rhizosphaericola]|uniref:GNAT family N-acetyltransferase n=1 Tax=Actinoallomurus rhizosphaericola TaxID=2952536 RepID=UPI002093411A|nr:GNAT family N-acetyltransferase [Actinoallomurus rhizosphaericola]MCO5998523.1 GNAT family N-acetyltransferase [Actinoallomurus rhizosphaericola]
MSGVMVRKVRPGDGEGCARAWRDAGRHYAAIVPEVVQEPDPEGLVEWFEQSIGRSQGDDTVCLVAEDDGRVIGVIEAAVIRPAPDARWQLQRDLSRVRLVINALAVVAEYRRQGVGTALMEAAEEWGRGEGAEVAVTDTNLSSPLSVPFYEKRMAYRRQGVILRKPLRSE